MLAKVPVLILPIILACLRQTLNSQCRLAGLTLLPVCLRGLQVCSDLHKPNGQYILEPTRPAVLEFIRTLPIRKVPGIGKVGGRQFSL